MAKLSNKSAAGTSWYGQEIKTTPKQLIEILGTPQFGDNSGQDKCNFDWVCETEDGDVFTVYDWKEYAPLNMDSVYSFHIGANTSLVSSKALDELELSLLGDVEVSLLKK